MTKAPNLNADTIVLDLEDGVPSNRKTVARDMVVSTLEKCDFKTSERCVRINHIGSGWELEDLKMILKTKHLDAILIPKVESPGQVYFVSRLIDLLAHPETARRIRLLIAIESPLALMKLKEIASSDPRIDSLIFASEDYCAETGMKRTSSRKELYFARSTVVTLAHAYGLQAIDLVCMDYENHLVLQEECREGVEMGYQGKQAIHPGQLPIIHREFSPRPEDIEYAQRIIDGYRKHTHTGIGAFDLNGKVIDLPVVKWAERILSYASLISRDTPIKS